VIKLRPFKPERAIKQKLSRRGFQQVRAADYFSDSHRMVVGDDRKLVRGHVISPPDDEIAEIPPGDVALRAEMLVGKRDPFTIRNAKTPIHACGRLKIVRVISRPAIAGVDRLIISVVRSSRGRRKIFPSAGAWIDEAAIAQPLPHR
jgi:hypothetical protein